MSHPGAQADGDVRVSTVELFFDLVFVFTITQLTSVVAHEPNVVGVARVTLIFGNLFWMYGGYAWLTNTVPPRRPALRLLMLLGMAAYLVIALAIPDAFGDSGVAFGLAYLAVNLIHTGMFLLSTEETVLRSIARLGPFNATTALLVLVAGFTDGWLQWTLWTAAFALHWVVTPILTAVEGFGIRAAHFVERHGLIILIALGESIVAVGIGVRGRHLGWALVGTAVLGLVLAAALWWWYFDSEDERAERALAAAGRERVAWLALRAFGYAFLPILEGIVVLAAGVKGATAHFGLPAAASTAWFMAAGVASYLAGLAWFRRILGIAPARVRLACAALALPTAFVGLAVSAQAQLGALAVVVVAGILLEPRLTRSAAQPGARRA